MAGIGAFSSFYFSVAFHMRSAIMITVIAYCLAACSREGPEPCKPITALVEREARVLFFYDQTCPDCDVVKAHLLPRLLEMAGFAGEVECLDVANRENVQLLLRLEREMGFQAAVLSPVVILDGRPYCGLKELESAVVKASETPHGGTSHE